jgi:hypothetical protein
LQFFGISFQSLDYLEIEIFLFTIWWAWGGDGHSSTLYEQDIPLMLSLI